VQIIDSNAVGVVDLHIPNNGGLSNVDHVIPLAPYQTSMPY